MTHRLRLVRFAHTPAFGVFGRLFFPEETGMRSLYTVEREWLGNIANISCIPEGVYQLKKSIFNSVSDPYSCMELCNVPKRSLIKVHIANRAKELRGCIGLGLLLGTYQGDWCVAHSKAAMTLFMDAMDTLGDEKDIELEITSIDLRMTVKTVDADFNELEGKLS